MTMCIITCLLFFFFNDTATTEIYTLSLHDALPIYGLRIAAVKSDAHLTDQELMCLSVPKRRRLTKRKTGEDRKSTRLNSSHANISYAVFCLKKKKNKIHIYYFTIKIKTKGLNDTVT